MTFKMSVRLSNEGTALVFDADRDASKFFRSPRPTPPSSREKARREKRSELPSNSALANEIASLTSGKELRQEPGNTPGEQDGWWKSLLPDGVAPSDDCQHFFRVLQTSRRRIHGAPSDSPRRLGRVPIGASAADKNKPNKKQTGTEEPSAQKMLPNLVRSRIETQPASLDFERRALRGKQLAQQASKQQKDLLLARRAQGDGMTLTLHKSATAALVPKKAALQEAVISCKQAISTRYPHSFGALACSVNEANAMLTSYGEEESDAELQRRAAEVLRHSEKRLYASLPRWCPHQKGLQWLMARQGTESQNMAAKTDSGAGGGGTTRAQRTCALDDGEHREQELEAVREANIRQLESTR